ncbi:MAG: peptidylprolyl isomerase, partial [Phocaeicola sp.]
MNKLRSIRVFALLLTFVAVTSAYAQDNVIDEVVWVVGDGAILKSDVENERLNAQYEGRKFEGDPYCIIPEQLAIQKLYLNQAVIDSIEVSEQEVISQVERRTAWLIDQIGSKEKLEEYYNKTSTQIREMLRENVRDGLIVQKMQQEIVGDIKITPAEVRRYFKDLPQDSIPFIPTQVEVQVVSLQPKIPQEEIDHVKRTLREYTERINNNEIAFSTLARMYSEDEASRRRGGELGFMGKGELVPEYANVAFNLQDPTKVSKIVESEFGFHIIQLIEKRGDRLNSRHILMKPKVDEEDLETALSRLDSIADDIRNQKFSFEDAASYISQD